MIMDNRGITLHQDIDIHTEEAFRVLRTNLQYYAMERRIKKLVITSSGHSEGKTSVAINLGLSYAKAGNKVLLIDADLQKAMLVKHLGSSTLIGLTHYVEGNGTLEEIINSTNVENFFFISCGPKPPNSMDIVSSERFAGLLAEVERDFDIIIIDSPSIGKHIDAAVIASRVDGAIFVINSGELDYRRTKTAKDQLEKLGGKIIGTVLNRMDKSYYKVYTNHFDDHGFARKFKKGWFRKFDKAGR